MEFKVGDKVVIENHYYGSSYRTSNVVALTKTGNAKLDNGDIVEVHSSAPFIKGSGDRWHSASSVYLYDEKWEQFFITTKKAEAVQSHFKHLCTYCKLNNKSFEQLVEIENKLNELAKLLEA